MLLRPFWIYSLAVDCTSAQCRCMFRHHNRTLRRHMQTLHFSDRSVFYWWTLCIIAEIWTAVRSVSQKSVRANDSLSIRTLRPPHRKSAFCWFCRKRKPHGVNKIWTIAGWFRWNENYYYCCCCATVTNQQKYTYGSEIFVSFPIMSTKLLSQSFFFSKSKFSTDNIICSARQKNNSAIEKIDREWVRKTEGIETKTQYQHKTPKNVPHKNFVCFCLF